MQGFFYWTGVTFWGLFLLLILLRIGFIIWDIIRNYLDPEDEDELW